MTLERALSWGTRGGLLALALLGTWGSLGARARIRGEPRFDLSGWKLELGELPFWAPEELREELAALEIGGGAGEPLNIFTPRVLDAVRRRALACPWVKEVRRIRLLYPGLPPEARGGSPGDVASAAEEPSAIQGGSGSIQLEMELRVPIALVSAGGASYLVDRAGVRLGPPLTVKRAGELGLPVIRGGESQGPRRPPPPGMAWEDRDVREGLEVARVLHDSGIREEFPDLPITAIDISSAGQRARHGECEIVLCAGELRLGWGRSPISAGARTLAVPAILENLRRTLRRPESCPGRQLALLYTTPMVVERAPAGPEKAPEKKPEKRTGNGQGRDPGRSREGRPGGRS